MSHVPVLRNIPGDYGMPFFGPLKDRWNYFYNEGETNFFKNRMEKYHSTIFRSNMPPGPFIVSNSKVIVLLDAVSFPILFDTTKVEKKNLLDGTFMPNTSFYGGYRVCAFLDPSEPTHPKLKKLFFSLLGSLHSKTIPLFTQKSTHLFYNLEYELSRKKSVSFNLLCDSMSFEYIFELYFNKNPKETEISLSGESTIIRWIVLQVAPLATLGLPSFVEDFLLHTFRMPFFPVKSGYKKIYDIVYKSASSLLDEAEKLGLKRDEACHNLVFVFGFNSYGASKRVFPALIKWIGISGEKLHKQLRDEIRAVVSSPEKLTFTDFEKMPLTKSVVYEALRIEPPVPYQYAKAKEDLVVENHEAAFEVKKGEVMFGYQPFATKDPKVFENPEEFIADRFVKEGEQLLKYVYWSNDRETVTPRVENKQCPAKDLVVLWSRLMVVHFFLRYDTFTLEYSNSFLGSSVTLTSLTKAGVDPVNGL